MIGAIGTVLVLGSPIPSAVGTRYVSPTGSDGAACIRQAPCATLAAAYAASADGDVVRVTAGLYPAQVIPAGTKTVIFRGERARLRVLDNSADNVTFDGLEIDAGFAQVTGFQNRSGANVTFKNGRIGNVTNEKGALVSGPEFTFDNVVFHDVRVTDPSVHNECVYAIVVPGMTVRNSSFRSCATMDLFFTYGDWWTPLPPAYGGVTVENNVFGHATMTYPTNAWHYYSLYVGSTAKDGGALDGWVVRHNTFETTARIAPPRAHNSRWVGNVGSWDCVAGVTYRRNVGERCARTDKAVTPSASTRRRAARFGWRSPARHDFHLTATSPAIGAADPRDAPAADRDGRPRDDEPDAGAFEHAQRAPAARRKTRAGL